MSLQDTPSAFRSVPRVQAGAGESNSFRDLQFKITRGRSGVLDCTGELQRLAEQCELKGVADHLAYFTSVPYFGSKSPCLLLARDSAGDAIAAALFSEYRIAGLSTGVFIPIDSDGQQTVLAPAARRAEIAFAASHFLLKNGAKLVLCSFASNDLSVPAASKWNCALQIRTIYRDLMLGATLDETLARMGRHTRRNLRHHRRRAEAELGARYLSAAEISESEFLSLSQSSAYPVPRNVALCRYRSAVETPGGVLAGLRSADGTWLSVLGGRRFHSNEGPALAIDWQLNPVNMSSFSLGMTMQAYLFENEIVRATRFIRFEGGSSQSIRSALKPECVCDTLMARRFITRGFLEGFLTRVLPKGNLLGETLSSGNLVWNLPGAGEA